jgi:trypsin
MRYSQTLCFWLFTLCNQSAAQSIRRLIVSGEETSISDYPFTVALLYCEKDWGLRKACAVFCSGSLIAPNVVLTAGHCVYDSDSAFGSPRPPTPISNTYVMVGASDTSNPIHVYKVKSVINGGYSTNLRFPFDDDIGLVFLSECIDLIPGQIETIKLATRDTDPTSTCTSVISTGFGRHENLPSQLFVSDGKVRVIQDQVHSFETCRLANIDAMKDSFDFPSEMLNDMIDPDKHICAGGNSMWSTCNGDSGGPVFLGSVQVGVTSFGPSGFCGISPDYSTRVSNYDSWIKKIVSEISMCPGWSADKIFENPVSMSSKPKNPTRCGDGYWQCPGQGECIALSKVCDGNPDCRDTMDEDAHFCRMARIMGKDPLIGAADYFPDDSSLLFSAIKREFRALSRPSESLIGGILDSPSFVVIGLIESVSRLEHSFATLVGKSDNLLSVCASLEYTQGLSNMIQKDCSDSLARVDALIGAHKGSNPTDLSPFTSACTEFSTCVERFSGGLSFVEWLMQLDQCLDENPRKFISLIGSKESAISLCGSVGYFVERNSSRESYTAEFNQRFNASYCPDLPEERLSPGSQDARSARVSHKLYSSFIALIIMYIWL